MYKVVGISFNYSTNIYYFSSNSIPLKKGDYVIVETSDDEYDLGFCKTNVFQEKKENLVFPLKNVIRRASKEDLFQYDQNEKSSLLALDTAKKLAKELKLDMNFINAYYTFSRKQLYFTYLSEERVDFRELAKKLAQKYKTRIELRQIGVRDKAKLIGGIGPCGLFLCCNSFLTDFNSVSINMAKNQFLALNPSKINGVCGRLLCCLNYENDQYIELRNKFPKVGSLVTTPEGKGKVTEINIFKNTYQVELSKGNTIVVSCGE